ncbi:hypothetical protein M0804_008261 [Polistes exclamans]|nr:hypothetical protein M0804_008261 [Polistes exclamans]
MVVVGSKYCTTNRERKRGCTGRERKRKRKTKKNKKGEDEGERGTGARSPIIRRKYSPIKPTLTAAKHWDMIMRAWLCSMLLAPQVDPPKGPSSAAAAAVAAGPRKCRELASETWRTPRSSPGKKERNLS